MSLWVCPHDTVRGVPHGAFTLSSDWHPFLVSSAAPCALVVSVTDTPTTRDLTTGVFNIERFGYDRDGRGHHKLGAAVEYILDQTPIPPDILALPEATYCLLDDQRPLRREFTVPLSRHLADGWYEPLFAAAGPPHVHRNHHYLLLVNTSKVHPLGWNEPDGKRMDGMAPAEIFGHEVQLLCEHWPGGLGRSAFDQAANRISNLGGPRRKTWHGGDYNATSSWEKEVHYTWGVDWQEVCEARGERDKLLQKGWLNPDTGRYEIDTRQIDDVRTIFGYHDAGEEWGDPTQTTCHSKDGLGLRITRIFVSHGWPGELTAYAVSQPPRVISDHAYVRAAYRIPVARSLDSGDMVSALEAAYERHRQSDRGPE